MSGKGIEIGIQALYIHLLMRRTLCSVYDDHGSVCMGKLRYLVDRSRHTIHVGCHGDRNQLCARSDLRKLLLRKRAFGIRLEIDQLCPCLLCHHLPGQDIAVMLHHRKHDLVALLQLCKPVGIGHKV